jgi:hypothetical protein
MADLLTHYVSARLPGGFIGDPAARMTLVAGVFLPDLISKGLDHLPFIPDYFQAPSHSILGLFVVTYVVALFFTEAFRVKAWITMYVGALLHVGFDSLKDNLGAGMHVLHPFSLNGYELAVYYNENILYLLPSNIFLLFIIRFLAKRAASAGWVWR